MAKDKKEETTEITLFNPSEQALAKKSDIQVLADLQKFNMLCNEEPKSNWIQKNKYADNTDYIPIGILQSNLDRIFNGLWQTYDFHHSVIANELVGSIILEYFHPVMRCWIKRTGTGSVMIRFYSDKPKKDSKEVKQPEQKRSDKFALENKITNALTMDYPHLEAQCLRSAMGKIGKLFGRDLNRGAERTLQMSTFVTLYEFDEVVLGYKMQIEDLKTPEELQKNIKRIITNAQKGNLTTMQIKEIQDFANAKYLNLKYPELQKK